MATILFCSNFCSKASITFRDCVCPVVSFLFSSCIRASASSFDLIAPSFSIKRNFKLSFSFCKPTRSGGPSTFSSYVLSTIFTNRRMTVVDVVLLRHSGHVFFLKRDAIYIEIIPLAADNKNVFHTVRATLPSTRCEIRDRIV